MATIWTKVAWHDLQIAPEDLPDPDEEVLVTVESIVDETRKTQANVYLKELTNGNYCWCTKAYDKSKRIFDETVVWNRVIAWAYYPEPYIWNSY